jgi:hypothetical protein
MSITMSRERASLRVREHDVRRAESPARQMRMQVRPRREYAPCEGVIEPRTVAVSHKAAPAEEDQTKKGTYVER